MARKISLSPLENAILCEIAEAGSEDVPVLMNALALFGGDGADSDHFRGQFESAIRRLYLLHKIEWVFSDRPGYPPLPANKIEEVLCLHTWICWEIDGGYWRNASSQTENLAIARPRRPE